MNSLFSIVKTTLSTAEDLIDLLDTVDMVKFTIYALPTILLSGVAAGLLL